VLREDHVAPRLPTRVEGVSPRVSSAATSAAGGTGGGSSAPAGDDPLAAAVAQVEAMGFSDAAAIRNALQRSRGNIEQAIELLLR
jgi:hypothetical protein